MAGITRFIPTIIAFLAFTAGALADPAATPIAGRVLGLDGKPAAGAIVFLETTNASDRFQPTRRSQAGADGRFSFNVQPTAPRGDQNIQLFAFAPGGGFGAMAEDPGPTMEIRLQPAADTTLTFIAPDGTPAAGFQVWPSFIVLPPHDTSRRTFPTFVRLADDIHQKWETTTDANGQCVIHDLPRDASVQFDSDDPRYARMSPEDRVVVEDAATPPPFRLTAAATIVGSVINPETAKPVPGIAVYAQPSHENPDSGWAESVTDACGQFSLGRLKGGDFIVALQENEEQGVPAWTARAIDARVTEGQTIHADILLTRGGFVSGKVRDHLTHKGIAGVGVGLYGPARPQKAAAILGTLTNGDGAYTFRVPAGRQHIYISGPVPDGYLENRSASQPDVQDGHTSVVDFELRRNQSLEVTGKVRDSDGHPVAGATILCNDPNSPNVLGEQMQATCAADGSFHFDHVKAGCVLRARFKDMATESPIVVKGWQRDFDVRLSATATYKLIVAVTDENNLPVSGATVSLVAWTGRFGLGSQPRPVDADGNATFDGLLADTKYTISISAPGYGESQSNVATPPVDYPRQKTLPIVLRKATSNIAGIVLDQHGKPVSNAVVSINGNGTGLQQARTDSAGRFRFAVVDDARGVVVSIQSSDPGKPVFVQANAGDTNVKLIMIVP
jgi:hypothetical protein